MRDRFQLLRVSTSCKIIASDGDWTEECKKIGSKFSFTCTGMSCRDIPIDKAWVKDGVLYVEGYVYFDTEWKTPAEAVS